MIRKGHEDKERLRREGRGREVMKEMEEEGREVGKKRPRKRGLE